MFDREGRITQEGIITIVLIAGCLAVFFPLFGALCNLLDVQTAKLKGQAELNQANYNRQVVIASAKAKREAADYEAKSIIIKAKAYSEAEIIKATGIKKANEIVSKGLNENILTYTYIRTLRDTKNQVIYTNNSPVLVRK